MQAQPIQAQHLRLKMKISELPIFAWTSCIRREQKKIKCEDGILAEELENDTQVIIAESGIRACMQSCVEGKEKKLKSEKPVSLGTKQAGQANTCINMQQVNRKEKSEHAQ